MRNLIRSLPHRTLAHLEARDTREKLYHASLSIYADPKNGKETEISTLAQRGLLKHLDGAQLIELFRDVYQEKTNHVLSDKEMQEVTHEQTERSTRVITVQPESNRHALPELTLVLKRRADADKVCIEYSPHNRTARSIARSAYLDMKGLAEYITRND